MRRSINHEILALSLMLGLASAHGQEGESDALPAAAAVAVVEPEPEPSAADLATSVPTEMRRFAGHVGRWVGLTKTAVTEGGEKTISNTRSEWLGGYLLNGHLFEVRGLSYGELGRTSYRWQYSFDALKERYMGTYQDSNGRSHFFEGKVNEESTKIVWRLLAPAGDMAWRVETDLQTENGIETNGQITSKEFSYDMVYTSVFKRK